MVLPGPRSLASRTAPAMLIADEPPRHRPSCSSRSKMIRDRLLVGDQIGLLALDVLDDRRHAAEPDAFGDRAAFARLGLAVREQIVHRGAARVGAADHDVLLHLAQEGRRAGERSAGADRARRRHRPCRRSAARSPGRSTCSAREPVVEVVPLVGEDHAVRLGLLQLFGETPADMLIIVRIAVGDCRHLDQLGAAQLQHVLLFLALRLRDHDQRAIAARVRHECEPDAGVAGGALDHKPARLSSPRFSACRIISRPARSFTDWPGVHELGLAEDGAAGLLPRRA